MVNEDSHRFMYYFLAFGACIKGFAHMRKVIAVDGTHLHGKYEGVLLSVVAQDMENHVYPIAFCFMDKENDASWTFFFEKLKEIVIDEPDLCFISDRYKSIANSIVNIYNHAHHGYCMRHLGENLRVNHHCGDYIYLYYNAAKAYSLEEFDNHFVEFKNKCPTATVVLKNDIGFEKWSRAHFFGNRYDVMTTNIAESLNVMLIDEREYHVASIFNSIAKRFGELFREKHAYILKSMGNQIVSAAEKIARKKIIEGDSLYVENIIGDDNQFIVFGAGVTAYVDLLEKSCSCREYDFIKILCAHAMTVLRSKHGNEYGMSIYEYSSPLYKVEAYLLAYMDSISVVPLELKWCVPEELLNVNILPPLVDTKLRRKRRKRVKGIGENFKSKRKKKYSICKRTGHKRTTCVNNNKS
ncbi:uncharacterized protein LOC125842901 [Solanum stenotomum]|uniref:uncharacterized protein LOC125842901 n=1 Tax=Solanum stenotomum TaxID=172797 RepID=UPI0020D05634|nr:uncharacterized protein LOC125842901 [Solanum stenotomum]